MAVAGIVVVGTGVLLVLVGTLISVTDWRRARGDKGGHPGIEGESLGLDKTLTALQKLVAELANHPLGIRLIVLGIVCILVGGVIGGVAGVTA
jgi:predicted RND superfamily exporter protein